MLSVTVADLPDPAYETSDTAYVSDDNAADERIIASQTSPESDPVRVESTVRTESTIYLAKPAKVKNAKVVTPTTITVNWGDPVASRTANTDMITGFELVLTNTKTKQVVETIRVDANVRTATFEGLSVKTSYSVTVTSVGDGASSAKATQKIPATTATFPLVTIRASNMTLTSATLTITDKDKVTAFVDGKTVKSYTIQYAEKAKTIDWSKAKELPLIGPGTDVTDLKKGTIVTQVSGLTPGTQYSFRVVATYTDGTTKSILLTSEGKAANAKTASLPAVSVTKTYFSVLSNSGNYEFAIGMDAKIANYAKLGSQVTDISFSLLASTSTTIDKVTKKLTGGLPVADNDFSTIDSKGVFSMNAVSLESIVEQLGASAVLGTKALGLQLVVTFKFADGTDATLYSKVGKVTLPTWYTPA